MKRETSPYHEPLPIRSWEWGLSRACGGVRNDEQYQAGRRYRCLDRERLSNPENVTITDIPSSALRTYDAPFAYKQGPILRETS